MGSLGELERRSLVPVFASVWGRRAGVFFGGSCSRILLGCSGGVRLPYIRHVDFGRRIMGGHLFASQSEKWETSSFELAAGGRPSIRSPPGRPRGSRKKNTLNQL